MKEELTMIEKNGTWGLVDKPASMKAPRAWYSRINEYLCSLDYIRSPNEHTLHVRKQNGKMIIVSLYANDLLVIRSNANQLMKLKNATQMEFDMTDLGEISYFLGVEVHQAPNGIFVCQRKYAYEVLKKFSMDNCKPLDTPLVQSQKLCREDR
ncbi:uncharacterized protein LOC116129835 [Pistacia vera]|uniref:uncharacterized protein LOC116129835 n=1 Tax=Pistacia vera TaxID=55513 RepID=UPI001263409C|nr:uncharacterized protein LOC116129835 [Pistacia vera]